MTTLVSTKDILLAAADIIEERGWMQGGGSISGPTCATLAIRRASDALGVPESSVWAVRTVFRTYVGNRSIPAWNDAPERTQAEVVAALRGAAGE